MTDQERTAAWLGYGHGAEAASRMNADHDPLHAALCAALGVPSQSLRMAQGETLTRREMDLAAMEEDAVLAVQKLAMHAGAERAVLSSIDPRILPILRRRPPMIRPIEVVEREFAKQGKPVPEGHMGSRGSEWFQWRNGAWHDQPEFKSGHPVLT